MGLTDGQQKWLALALWFLLIFGFLGYAYLEGSRPDLLFRQRISEASDAPLAPVLLLGFFVIRPLLFLPVSFLTLASGFLFGFWWGLLYSLIAVLLSSLIAYGIGRFFQTEALMNHERVRPLVHRLRTRSFETVLIGRLLMLPGDIISYPAGFLRISMMAFLLASAIGGMPGLLIAVLAGASVEGDLASGQLSINPWLIFASLLLVVLSLGLSHVLRKRSRLVQVG